MPRSDLNDSFDIAIVGSGYAGSLMAMVARRLGRSVVLLERGRHPRVVIGESSTPLSNLLLEGLADRYDLPKVRPLTKWGRWQESLPQVACGLKRGFSFVHHTLGAPDQSAIAADRQLLVAASPGDFIADTHWYRAQVDHLLVQQAEELGVESMEQFDIVAAARDAQGWTLRAGGGRAVQARFVIDASGPRGFLHRALALKERSLPGLPLTSALYSHFSGVKRLETMFSAAPYPVDDAALHHVFDGGWIWVLRFNNGITSAGVAASERVAAQFNFAEKEGAWTRLLAELPQVSEQFADARAEMPFTHLPTLSFRSVSIAGRDWAMLPSAAGFVDPLLSTGFPLALLGVTRLAEILERDWASPRFELSLREYAQQTDVELLATARLIGALYASMGDFATFRVVSLLYFAAASYAETARRLGRPELARGFLLHDDPVFGPQSQCLLERARTTLSPEEKLRLRDDVYELIERFDVAGLGKRPADHYYPVRAEDLFAGAHRLGASEAEIATMLERSGFYAGAAETHR